MVMEVPTKALYFTFYLEVITESLKGLQMYKLIGGECCDQECQTLWEVTSILAKQQLWIGQLDVILR